MNACRSYISGLTGRWLQTILVVSLLINLSAPLRAQGASADEYAIRAAMLLNFTKFIDWPAGKLDASHPQFTVCILGTDPVGLYADRFFDHASVAGKAVRVEHLSTLEAASTCHMLYSGAEERKDLVRAAPGLIRDGVLIISERANTASAHQVIGLPTVDDHVHIEVDLGAAQHSGCTISSKLLRLAVVTSSP